MDRPRPTRRQTLKLMVGTTGALAVGSVASMSGCGGGARATPEAETRIAISEIVRDRLRVDHHGEPVELLRVDEQVVARSLVCTHEYCEMFWHQATEAYRCPCHGGQFAADGSPRSGPVDRPMWTLPVRIEGATVIIGGVG